MAAIRVKLFGEISIRHNDRAVTFPSTKALELLCYLLIHCDRPHTREALSDVLWPAGRSVVSKRYLRQALWRLIAALPEYQSDRPNARIVIGPAWVRIDDDTSWWLDVNAFNSAYLQVRDTPAHLLSERQAGDLEAALDLYQGELMATWYQDWCIDERDRQQRIYLSMLEQLMGYCEARRLYSKGLDHGQTILRHDPARECTHRQLMRLHYGAGDRTSAMRQYQRCATVLGQEFGIAPSAGTVALYERIRTDRTPDVPSPTGPGPQRWDGDSDVITGLHARLDQIQASLSALHDIAGQRNGTPCQPALVTRDGTRQPGELRGLDVEDAS